MCACACITASLLYVADHMLHAKVCRQNMQSKSDRTRTRFKGHKLKRVIAISRSFQTVHTAYSKVCCLFLGQIELYTHIPVMRQLVDQLKLWNFNVCSVFIIDAQFLLEATKFVSGVMSALSAMVILEV